MKTPRALHLAGASQIESQAEEVWGSITTVNTLSADALHQMILREMPGLDDKVSNESSQDESS